MPLIKQIFGECIDCEDGKEVPLTAKRCSYHYKLHRHQINEAKNAGKEKKVPKPIERKPIQRKVQKPIARRAKRRMIQELQYNADRKVFLGKPENQICPIYGTQTTEVHHKKGRIEELLLDQRWWVALSSKGHKKVENNPEWAKEKGFSLSRLAKD